MSLYDEIRTQYQDASDKEKLILLGYAKVRYLTVIKGFAQILKSVDSDEFAGLPDDYSMWCEKIIQASDAMLDTIEGVLDNQENNRESRKRQDEERARELNQQLWAKPRADLPELSNFASFREAVIEAINRQGLPLGDEIPHPEPGSWGTTLFLRKEDRMFIGGPQARQSDGHFYAYSLTLKLLVDKRNHKWVECEAITPSLEEFVRTLHSWLVARWSPEVMAQQFSWIKFPSSFFSI